MSYKYLSQLDKVISSQHSQWHFKSVSQL